MSDRLSNPPCNCYRCQRDRDGMLMIMAICSDCGYKRCPKATDHRLECTGSNEPGQPGSRYTKGVFETMGQLKDGTPVAITDDGYPITLHEAASRLVDAKRIVGSIARTNIEPVDQHLLDAEKSLRSAISILTK